MAEQRKQAQEANQELKNAAEGLKNLFKSQSKNAAPVENPASNASSSSDVETVEQSTKGTAETQAKDIKE